MSIDWNSLVKTAESDLVKSLTSKVVAGLIAQVPWLGAVAGPFGWLLSLVVSLFVKYGDWLTYMVVDEWKNTEEGKTYEAAALANAKIPKGDPRKKALEDAQKAAFDDLLGAH